MNVHIDRRFPEHDSAIKALAGKDEAFSAMLADYEEICTWLAAHDSAAARTPEEFAQARNLMRELEAEILTHLEQHDDRT